MPVLGIDPGGVRNRPAANSVDPRGGLMPSRVSIGRWISAWLRHGFRCRGLGVGGRDKNF